MPKGPRRTKKEDDEPRGLVCMRVADMLVPVAGSVRGECPACGKSVWISHAGQRARQADPALTLMCLPCAQEKDFPDLTVKPVPGAAEDILNHLRSLRRN